MGASERALDSLIWYIICSLATNLRLNLNLSVTMNFNISFNFSLDQIYIAMLNYASVEILLKISIGIVLSDLDYPMQTMHRLSNEWFGDIQSTHQLVDTASWAAKIAIYDLFQRAQ